MGCNVCGAPLVWRGSTARGKLVCPKCDPLEKELVYWDGELVSRVMKRYLEEVHSFHRSWCAARRAKGSAGRSDPTLCDCGHSQRAKYSESEIEKKEIEAYGNL